ncbi:glycosyltransferase [Clostridium disporicum]|uniref:glycosyltransferase n=1 Tax=Clostridium disporicum TaxID=84024 RepID=UPI0036065273
MRRILFVINSLTIGGSEKSLVSLLNMMDYSKFNVDLLMFRHGGEFEKYIPKEVNVLKEPEYYSYVAKNKEGISSFNKGRYIFNRIKTSINLRRNLRKTIPIHADQVLYKSHNKALEKINKKYDIAIAYSQGLPTYYVAEKVNADKKIAWINCDYATTMYDKEYDKKFYVNYYKIIAVSNSIKESIIKLNKEYEKKLEVILDIVDPKLIEKMSEEEQVLKDKSYINILTVARLVIVHKGYDVAIKAAKLLKNDGYKFKWFVIGDGADRKRIEQLILEEEIDDCFILLGKKDNPYPYMKNCDIYVQPSKKEGFGLTVVEAKILNRPILCTNFNTASEIINDRYDGIIVDQNEEALYRGLRMYIDNLKLKEEILNNLKAENQYSSISEIEKIFNLIG